jgi:membrane peptidoglycan carboxypeptidase
VGYPEREQSMTYVEGYPAVYGGTLPALIWNRFMTAATQNMKVVDFPSYDLSGFTGHAPTAPPNTSTPSTTATATPKPTPSPSPSPSASPSPSSSPTVTATPPPTQTPTAVATAPG